MKNAVLGGGGFVGRHLREELAKRGVEVLSYDKKPSPGCEELDLHDITSSHLVGCNRVWHVAGMLGTLETFRDVEGAIQANIVDTYRALEAAKSVGAEFIYVTLSHRWLNPYMITKNAGNDICRMYREVRGMPVWVIPTYNLFGAYQKLRPVRKLVPTFMNQLIRGEEVEIYGDGLQTVDLIWAPDFIREMLAVVDNLPPCNHPIGTAVGITVVDVARLCADALGTSLQIKYLPPRLTEPPHMDGRSPMGFKFTSPTDLNTAMAQTARWYKDHLHEL